MSRTYEDGRAEQFKEMMQAIEALQLKYKGVRGELLAKVKEKLQELEPAEGMSSSTMSSTAQARAMCRACGRELRPTGDGRAMCQNGHTTWALAAAQESMHS